MLELFYGLTAHRRPSLTTYVIRALACTTATIVIRDGLVFLISLFSTSTSQPGTTQALAVSLVVSAVLGLVFARLSTRNTLHNLAYELGFSRNDGYPSQWYAAFAENQRFLQLTLKDGRRIEGWPLRYPDSSEHGHFLLEEPAVVVQNEHGVEQRVYLITTHAMLVDTKDVAFVQFLKFTNETEAPKARST